MFSFWSVLLVTSARNGPCQSRDLRSAGGAPRANPSTENINPNNSERCISVTPKWWSNCCFQFCVADGLIGWSIQVSKKRISQYWMPLESLESHKSPVESHSYPMDLSIFIPSAIFCWTSGTSISLCVLLTRLVGASWSTTGPRPRSNAAFLRAMAQPIPRERSGISAGSEEGCCVWCSLLSWLKITWNNYR